MNEFQKKPSRSAQIIEFPPREYLVKVTSLVSQLHRVTANSAEEAGRLAPDAEIVGEIEFVDIVDCVPVDRIR